MLYWIFYLSSALFECVDACSYYAKKIRVLLFAYIRLEESIYKIIDSDELLMVLRIIGVMIEYANKSCKMEMLIS